ncbi:hypothetical protein PFISCL1PPCAC_8619 [Pristionchus fissidentatus]|uniref:Uncharacterized protein n=1 Tax=Pristionchus fissidentatus TaxID=1538716 RepID=A0AAV5VGR8_9BILA|nr:hypothetical protein PFISCL1PPCAC_8619 [Pristionchus fissidentatus]
MLHNQLRSAMNSLGEEAKQFAKEFVEAVVKLHTDVGQGTNPTLKEFKAKLLFWIEKYYALSAAKADIEKHFSIPSFSYFKNEQLMERFRELLRD